MTWKLFLLNRIVDTLVYGILFEYIISTVLFLGEVVGDFIVQSVLLVSQILSSAVSSPWY